MRLRGVLGAFLSRRAGFLGAATVLFLTAIFAGVLYWIKPPASNTPLTSNRPDGNVGGPTATAPSAALPSPDQKVEPQLPLYGRRIGLDAGHGPRDDLGAVLVDPDTGELVLSEAEFNLDVALRCRDILLARGAGVVLTRESADTFTAPWPADANGDGAVGDTGDDLQQRIDILNNFQAEAFVSIHANGGDPNGPGNGDLQVIYCGAPDCPFPDQSRRLGQLVVEQLEAKVAAASDMVYNGQLLTDLDVDASDPPGHLFVLGPSNPPRHPRASAMPGVISESLYVTSPAHAAQLKQDSVRQAIALAYADALQIYLGSR